MKQRLILLILFVLISTLGYAQGRVLKGQVINSKTKTPLAFVSIAVKDTYAGTTTDINGKFSLQLPGKACEIVVSYVGYEKQVYAFDSINKQEFLIIPLDEKATELNEVVITSAENPAHRIIQLAIKNKAQHDPYQLPSFSYNSYNKVFFTLKSTHPDSIAHEKDPGAVSNFLKEKHLFVSESYTERKFLAPNHSKEVVLANKMTGYKNPVMAMVATDFQPISFYEDLILFFEKHYLNPVSRGSTNKYDFILEETLLHENDSTFIISFAPGEGKNFESLKGVISINSDGYAIENIIAEPADKHLMIRFRIQQKYERINKQWFPVQLHTNAEFTEYKIKARNLIVSSKSKLTNIQVSPELHKKEFDHLNSKMAPQANKQNEEAWKLYRADSLNAREKNTYSVYDSLSPGKKAFLHGYMSFIEGLLLNRFKAGPLDILSDQLYAFNDYEGNRLGVSLQTNDDFSRFIQLGGYAGYGFKDKALKYGGNLAFNLHQKTEARINFSYHKDVSEPGSIDFFRQCRLRSGPGSMRDWIVSRMDSVEQLKTTFSIRAFKYLQIQASINREARNPAYDYRYTPKAELAAPDNITFQILETGVGLRYAPKERYTQIGRGSVVLKAGFPVFTFYYGRGLDNASLEGNFAYNRLAFKADYAFTTKGLGTTTIHLSTGITTGDIAYPYLNVGHGSLSSPLGASFFIPNQFQTMHLYEFLSDRYAYLFLTHNLGRLLYKSKFKYFQPEVLLSQNIGFGTLSNPTQHQNIAFRTMEKGYMESGLLINNILRFPYANIAYLGLGGGTFYRYGPNSLDSNIDNLAFKATLSLTF